MKKIHQIFWCALAKKKRNHLLQSVSLFWFNALEFGYQRKVFLLLPTYPIASRSSIHNPSPTGVSGSPPGCPPPFPLPPRASSLSPGIGVSRVVFANDVGMDEEEPSMFASPDVFLLPLANNPRAPMPSCFPQWDTL